jgi:hypothetical protein
MTLQPQDVADLTIRTLATTSSFSVSLASIVGAIIVFAITQFRTRLLNVAGDPYHSYLAQLFAAASMPIIAGASLAFFALLVNAVLGPLAAYLYTQGIIPPDQIATLIPVTLGIFFFAASLLFIPITANVVIEWTYALSVSSSPPPLAKVLSFVGTALRGFILLITLFFLGGLVTWYFGSSYLSLYFEVVGLPGFAAALILWIVHGLTGYNRTYNQLNLARYAALRAQQVGRAMVISGDNKVLLEQTDTSFGYQRWHLPGDKLDRDIDGVLTRSTVQRYVSSLLQQEVFMGHRLAKSREDANVSIDPNLPNTLVANDDVYQVLHKDQRRFHQQDVASTNSHTKWYSAQEVLTANDAEIPAHVRELVLFYLTPVSGQDSGRLRYWQILDERLLA